ncbi:hypothetical protein N1H60_004634 [Salmonella enterica subsp. enterica serovar Kentucky]|nr:hypothetical protein [Salmonella enterica]EJR7219569.1 hypothetical protein [Salmonella enterica subsp. enterica serovar Kentucky]
MEKKKINLVVATSEEITDIYLDAYTDYKYRKDIPIDFNVEDYIYSVFFCDRENRDFYQKKFALMIVQNNDIEENVLVDKEYFDSLIPVRYPHEDSPIYCYVDMSAGYNLNTIKQDEFEYIEDALSYYERMNETNDLTRKDIERKEKMEAFYNSEYFSEIKIKKEKDFINSTIENNGEIQKPKARI